MLKVNGYGGRQAKVNEKSRCFKGWETLVIMKDSLSGNVLWYKFINRHERLEDYKEGITYLDSLGYTIQAIVCDGFKGLRQAFPNYKFQLCQFHQVMIIKTKLISRPKLEASKELLAIS